IVYEQNISPLACADLRDGGNDIAPGCEILAQGNVLLCVIALAERVHDYWKVTGCNRRISMRGHSRCEERFDRALARENVEESLVSRLSEIRALHHVFDFFEARRVRGADVVDEAH